MKKLPFLGFSLVELLLAMVISGVIIAIIMPFSYVKNGDKSVEKNSSACVYNTETFSLNSPPCLKARDLCLHNQQKACETMIYAANHGTTNVREQARHVLMQICSSGGTNACWYFINTCRKDPDSCDIAGTSYDLAGIAENSDKDNLGRLYVSEQLNALFNMGNPYIINYIYSLCKNQDDINACYSVAQKCDSTDTDADVACHNLIDGCTANNSPDRALEMPPRNSCKYGYMFNVNKTCKKIKEKYPAATSGRYRLTAGSSGTGTAITTFCDMDTNGGGWTLVALNNHITDTSNPAYGHPMSPNWSQAISKATVVGDIFSDNLSSFRFFLGLGYWNPIANDTSVGGEHLLMYQGGNSPTNITNRRVFHFTLDPKTYYSIVLTDKIDLGSNVCNSVNNIEPYCSSGFYVDHNDPNHLQGFSTYDADHDDSINVQSNMSSGPWWYYSNSAIWGGAYTEGGNQVDWYYHQIILNHGSMWIR